MENKNMIQEVQVSNNDRNAAAMSYVWIMSVFIYLTKRDNPFIKFHASQAVALFILSLIFWFIPVINQGLELFLGIFMIMGFIKAGQGIYFKIPVISRLVFTKNPFRDSFVKIGKVFPYLLFFVQSKLRPKKETREKLEQAKESLLADFKTEEKKMSPADVKTHNDIAAFSYLWMLSILIATINKESEFVAFHARQGVVLFVTSLVFACLPVIGFYLNVLILLLSITGFIMAFSGESYKIPVVSFLSEKNPTVEQCYLHIKAFFHYILYMVHRVNSKEEKKTFSEVSAETVSAYGQKKETHAEGEQEEKDIAAASYFFLGPVLWWIHRKKPFIVFHAKQATGLLVLFLLLFVIEPVRWLSFIVVALMIVGYLKSMKSEYYYMPLVYDMLTSRVTVKSILSFCVTLFKNTLSLLKRLFTDKKKDTGETNG